MTIEEIIISFTYFGIMFLMTTNGATGFPSSQLLYIICGYFIFQGDLKLSLVLLSGAIGNTIGNYILYEATRQKGLKYILRWKLFPELAVKKVQKTFNKRGPFFLFIGKLLPALKVFIPIPAGISKMNRVLFLILVFLSSAIWASAFIAIGFFFGKGSNVFGFYAPALVVIAIIVVYMFFKIMNSEEILEEIKKKN